MKYYYYINKSKLSKPIIIIMMFLFMHVQLSAQHKQNKPIINTNYDTLQYAYGVLLGKLLIQYNLHQKNIELVKQGLYDVIGNKLVIADSILVSAMQTNELKSQSELAALQEEKIFKQLHEQKNIGFIPGGIAYLIDKTSTGIRPNEKDSIEIHIKGMLPSGQVIEDTYQRNESLKISINNLMVGLKEVVVNIPEGGKWRVFLPANKAYGKKGIPGIVPPNSMLIFDVEVLKIYK